MMFPSKLFQCFCYACIISSSMAGHLLAGALEDALTGHLWTFKHGKIDTTVAFNQDGTFKMKEPKADYRWKTSGDRMVDVEMGQGKRMSLEFAVGFTSYKENTAPGGGAFGTRLKARTNIPAATAAPPAQANADSSGMALHPQWLPTKLDSKKLYAENLEYFCLKVVNGNRNAPDVNPDRIWNGITWLMPLEQAVAMLPKGARKHNERPMQNLVFPQESLTMFTYAMDGAIQFNDRGSPFKYLTFITDLNKRVISLQLVNENPKNVKWVGNGAVGVKNPYFNFFQDRFKGSGAYSVPYQVSDAGKGVKLVKTAFYKGVFQVQPADIQGVAEAGAPAGEYSEDVHWYLTDPLAKKILFIVESHRKAGRLK